MQITPGASAIQTLKAQQAWEARRAAKAQAPQTPIIEQNPTETQAPAQGFGAQPVKEHIELDNLSNLLPTNTPQWSRKVQDIQNIAEKSGFTGISEQDIRRAYVQGNSLLADYHV